MNDKQRKQLAAQTEDVGHAINDLRNALNAAGAPFSAGLARAAEEALVTVLNGLNDPDTKGDDL